MRLQLVVALMLLGAVALCSAADMTVYTDSLQNGWQYWGWATTQSFTYAGPPTPFSGSASISYKPAGWDGLYFRAGAAIPFSSYPTFEFYINGGATGGQSVNLAVNQNVNEPKAQVSIATLTPNKAITANTWQKVSVTWSSLGITSGNLVEFWITDATGNTQTALYLDSITLKGTTAATTTAAPTTTTTTTTTAAPTLTVTVDTTKNVRAVNQNIYGVNWASAAMLASVKYPVNRWGGNSVSLYNWQQSIKNSGADWFYISTPDTVSNPAALPEGSASDVFVDQSKAAGSTPLLTAPMLGYTPLDSRTKKWSYSVTKYGAQTGTECTGSGGASWCAADAGNGIRTDGTKITTNNKADAYKVIDRTYTTTWMDHLRTRGTPVTFWNLDNEPGLWDSTHQDVHPSPLTYDELWTKTKDIAAAIKAKDSTAVTFGPASWGWCEYWFSPADGCTVGADRNAHGGTRLLEWYATQNCAYKAANGVQLVDYLDFHFYPQGTGVALSSAEDSATAGRRLRSVKALYDPNYVDESWINQVVRIIPDLKNVIATKCPSMKLSITEYNFGNDDIITGAIATAEALAIFGREGVDLATRWVAPEVGSKVENAFKLYLNYDGAGGKVTGSSVSTVSTNVDVIGSYSIFNSSAKKLFVLLFNKATSAKTVKVNLASFPTLSTTAAKLYRFTGSQNLALASSSVSISAGSATLSNLPAYSANLLVIPTP